MVIGRGRPETVARLSRTAMLKARCPRWTVEPEKTPTTVLPGDWEGFPTISNPGWPAYGLRIWERGDIFLVVELYDMVCFRDSQPNNNQLPILSTNNNKLAFGENLVDNMRERATTSSF